MREPTTEANNPIEQEFLSVIREYERVIYKVCYLYTHPNAPLNDLYQDVVLNLWKAYPKFRKECKISTWIYRIALNTCISFYRKEKNVPEIISLTKDIDRTIEAHDPINEMLKQLYQMINQLGQLDKSIILLYLEDKSYVEIRYPCHCPPEHQANPDFPADINLIFDGSDTAQQIKPDLHHYPSGMDSRSLLGYRHHAISSTDSNRRNASCGSDCPCQPHSSLDNQRTADCHRFPPDTCHSFFRLLADMAIRNRYDSVLHPVVGRRSYTHSMDLSQEIPEPYPRNQKEFK